MRGALKLMSLRLINEKTPLFNLYSFSPPAVRRAGLWAFVSLWLNSYEKKIKFVYKYNIFIKFSTSYEIPGHLVLICGVKLYLCNLLVKYRQAVAEIPFLLG